MKRLTPLKTALAASIALTSLMTFIGCSSGHDNHDAWDHHDDHHDDHQDNHQDNHQQDSSGYH